MLKRMIQVFLAFAGAILGYYFGPQVMAMLEALLNLGLSDSLLEQNVVNAIIYALLGAVLFGLLSVWLAEYLVNVMRWAEERLLKTPVADLFFGVMGLIVGLLIAFLLSFPFNNIPVASQVLPALFAICFGYIGFQIGFKKRDEMIGLFTLGRLGKEKKAGSPVAGEHKILDTSVIIDGRIADICQTGFIEGTIVIPGFVLEELQHIADSSDDLKRNRGRRGLDVLNRIQKEKTVKVHIYEGDFEDIHEVDSKLIRLAKVLNGKVVTNDFNLNKVCELQGVPVLNINDLANAVKPVVLPGEELTVQVIKDGKEQGQGVAYLDDGTMIVVEGGREHIGSKIDVMVTSVLQTSAGRMIFAKPKLYEKAL
ncbi:putative PIN and TRAM-domain containing protein YacL [Caldalkalibacillus thermarum]|uniref:PIN/TRAM domain-containing protein n=1 Tax=Caldalkalibacillus thermarum TaxID=296745 RepID=UPI001668D439|nr:PIN/TRAM domain-containing protein [Caldalkalibacillus thermarum]GGK21619.1 putative PIN and TRAM-domain containing protein YacL [Caldalkalibacillus thermarum]